MRKLFSTLFFLSVLGLNAQTVKSNSSDFSDIFQDSTLRVDYTFTGTHNSQEIALDELHIGKGWPGRRVNLTTLPLEGNGQIIMKDSKSGKVIYKTSFSTLFQEWQTSEEATQVRKSFENVFQLPLPRQDANVEVVLFNTYRKPICKFEHQIKIDDILIRPLPSLPTNPYKYVHKGGDSAKCIDVAIVAEGYTASEQSTFYADAQRAADEILKYKQIGRAHV